MRFRPGHALILFTAAILLSFSARGDGSAVFVSTYPWASEHKDFGGWSAIELSDDGQSFLALTDRDRFTTGTLIRSADGRITGIEAAPLARIGNSADDVFGRQRPDAEGVALAADGRVFVSFEGLRTVLAYADNTLSEAEPLPTHPPFLQTHINRGLEALAATPDGTLYTLPEAWLGAGPFPVFRFDGSPDIGPDAKWTDFGDIPRHGGFAPVGADIGPDGAFYLLERKLIPFLGFASRVRRFKIGTEAMTHGEILLRTRTGTHDNLEGLSVWRDAQGRIRLTMIADDNFAPWQNTEIVEYLLPGNASK